MPNKQRRRGFTITEKQEIIEKYDKLPDMPKLRAAKKLGIKRSTMIYILNNRDEILERDCQNPSIKRARKLKRIGEKSDIIKKYDKLPEISQGKAARKLGMKRSALLDVLANREKILTLDSNNHVRRNSCQFCPFTAAAKYNLEAHLKAVHLKLRDLECEKCSYKTSIGSNLRRHVYETHKANKTDRRNQNMI